MAGGDKKIRVADGVDRISELPVHLREHILGCLSINDAVATSVLSSKWRFCWTGLRTLYFDGEFWDAYGVIELAEHLEHARAIDRILMLHSGPIPEFILYIPEMKDKSKTVDINVWLRVLSKKGVQKIDLGAYDYHDNSFPIPSCLFHCRELKQLSLSICKLTPPSDFKGFANLTSLSLENVDVAPRLLESLISRCLVLETLSLQNMVLPRPLVLEALNLKTVYFDECKLENVIFKVIPKLTSVALLAIGVTDKIDTPQPYSTLERLCSLPMIKELTFDFILLEPLPENCPSSTSTPLENLKCLTLRSVNLSLSDDILFTLCLLRSAPNLQTLTIDLESKVRGDFEIKELHGVAAELLKSEAKKHTSYCCLQTIKIRGIHGLGHESLLIKLLLTRCRKLKSIIIEKNRFSC